MDNSIDRREFLKLAGLGGAVFASGLAAAPAWPREARRLLFRAAFRHPLGFQGPALNPDADGTLQKAVAAVNALSFEPDFIVFTGDLTHTTTTPGKGGAGSPSSATSSGP